jgi:F-box and WD-40 domain protein 1/11
MGGVGASTIKPGRDWKNLYEMRQKIEKNWKEGKPAAVYLSGHTDSVYCCQFDEDKIITGSRDRTIRVWDIHTYKCLKVIGGPENRPVRPTNNTELETHPTQTVSALPSLNGTPEGDAIYHVPSDWHSASILCLQFDEQIMVTGSSDSTCIVWDLPSFQPKYRLLKHTAGVLDVCFDAKYIVSCSKDATICVWSRETGNLIRQLTGHRGPVNAVQLRGNLLVSASGDGVAKLWNLDSGACVKEFSSKDRGLAAVEFSDDAGSVLAGGNDQVVYRFDASTSELKHTYEGHCGLVRSLFLDSPNGRVLSGSYDQSMRVYDFKTGKEIATYKDWTTSWILAAKCDYRRIVATSQDGRALLMDFGYNIPGVNDLRGEGFKA